jgi:hypothetical protein
MKSRLRLRVCAVPPVALIVAAVAMAAAPALAADAAPAQADRDADALRLADETPVPEAAPASSDWRRYVELAAGPARPRAGGGWRDTRRASLDLQFDHAPAPGWRIVFADRLDASWPIAGSSDDHAVNTVKEAYASRQWRPDALVDAGRINMRHGVATGYNPTDWFRDGALRSAASVDPASLKENRQGSVMLRGQRLWERAALTALVAPRLARQASRDGYSLDWGATNARHRALVAFSPQVSETMTPQFLVYREQGRPTQLGVNLSGLLGDATVAHLEWAGGRGPSLLDEALPTPAAPHVWHQRIAVGLARTTPRKLTLTAEWHYDGAALDRGGWNALRAGPPAAWAAYRLRVQAAQELATRQSLFLHARWQDMPIERVDASAMLNADLVDSSRRLWLELRWRADRMDWAVQWLHHQGDALSHHGAAPARTQWQLSLRQYF